MRHISGSMRRPIFTGTDGKRERKKSGRKRLSVKSVLAGVVFCLVTAGAVTDQSDCLHMYIALSEAGLVLFSAILEHPLSLGVHRNLSMHSLTCSSA